MTRLLALFPAPLQLLHDTQVVDRVCVVVASLVPHGVGGEGGGEVGKKVTNVVLLRDVDRQFTGRCEGSCPLAAAAGSNIVSLGRCIDCLMKI